MRKRFFIPLSIALALVLGLGACQKEAEIYYRVDTSDAFSTLKDVDNAVVGLYYQLGTYYFYGRNVVAVGDMCGRIAGASNSYGHFVAMNNYSFTEETDELKDMWDVGYSIISNSVRALQAANSHMASLNAVTDPLRKVEKVQGICQMYADISQAYGLRALAEFTLLNLYAPIYQGHGDAMGIVLLPETTPLEKFAHVTRASVPDSYGSVLDNIDKALDNYDHYLQYVDSCQKLNAAPPFTFNAKYLNKGALYALRSRVLLYMDDYAGCIAAGLEALQEQEVSIGDPAVVGDVYLKMWTSLAANETEHIFLIAKSEADNLSANALNTLYGSYEGDVANIYSKAVFPDTSKDVRFTLIGDNGGEVPQPMKWAGIPGSQATSNIPVFRTSEVMLNLAESYLMTGDLAKAGDCVFYTAQRNSNVTRASIPTAAPQLMSFIQMERIRELFAEGFDFYDLRRWGKTMDKGSAGKFDLGNFAFPIPSSEINAGYGVVQNPLTLWSKKP